MKFFNSETGKESNLKGVEEQLNSPTEELATLEDFTALMQTIQSNERNSRGTWIAITGYAGYYRMYLSHWWNIYRRTKLPRKLKKKAFLTKKLRKQFLPEYYGNQHRTTSRTKARAKRNY